MTLVLCADRRWGRIAHVGLLLLLLQRELEKEDHYTTTNGRDWLLTRGEMWHVRDVAWRIRVKNAPHFDSPLRYIDPMEGDGR